jgi:ATP-dependent 26S proteasome regulatory subunit
VERVTLGQEFEGLERPAEALFGQLLARGRVVRMARQLNYNGDFAGEPELRRAADGLLFPVNAVFDFEAEGHCYRIEMQERSRQLLVRISGPVACLEIMQGLLHVGVALPLRVTRKGLGVKAAAAFFDLLRTRAQQVRVVPGRGYDKTFELLLDEEQRLVPKNLWVEARFGTVWNLVHVAESYSGYEVALECEAERYAEASRLLGGLVDEAVEKTQRRTRGHVESLTWECDVSGYGWTCIGGLGAVGQKLREWIELPLRNPQAFQRLGIRPPKGVLLVGPPGTGKTTLAKILAAESGTAFLAISPRDIASMWYGETERNVARIFQRARQHARRGRGAILFVDEIDGFFLSREGNPHEATRRALAELMAEMDGLVDLTGVMVLGATNRPQDLDQALCRPGRFDYVLEIPLPDRQARQEIFRVHLSRKPLADGLDMDELAETSKGWSGAEIELWCQAAAFEALKRVASAVGKDPVEVTAQDLSEARITMEDFRSARDEVQTRSAVSQRPSDGEMRI